MIWAALPVLAALYIWSYRVRARLKAERQSSPESHHG